MDLKISDIKKTEISKEVRGYISEEVILSSLDRHRQGDWGCASPTDRSVNEYVLRKGGIVTSVYHEFDKTFFIESSTDDRITRVFVL